MLSTRKTLSAAALALLVGVASSGAATQPLPSESAIRVVPETIELGLVAPSERVQTDVWLVNTSDEAVRLDTAKPGCGCIRLADDAPELLAPGRAVRVPLDVHAPKEHAKAKDAKLTFRFADGGALLARVNLETTSSADVALPARPSKASHELLAAAPGVIALGELAPKEERRVSLWLVNRTDAPIRFQDVKGGCGCTTVATKTGSVPANGVFELELAIVAPEKPGARTKTVSVLLDGGEPLRVPLTYQVTAPPVN